MKRLFTGMILITLLTALLSSVSFAQDSDFTETEQELIEYVAARFEQMAELDTWRASVEQDMVQNMSAQGIDVAIIINQIVDSVGDFSGDSPAVSSTIRQEISSTSLGTTTLISMTLDFIVIDETFYAQARDLSSELVGLYPSGWVNVSENASEIPGMEFLNPDQVNQLTNAALQYPVTEATVAEIEELEPDELDELEMRVFSLQIDPQGLMETEMFTSLFGIFNTGTMGLEAEGLLRQMFADASIELTIWVGVEDEMVYRVETIIGIDAELTGFLPGDEPMTLQQDISSRSDYYDFNEEVEIEVPEIDD